MALNMRERVEFATCKRPHSSRIDGLGERFDYSQPGYEKFPGRVSKICFFRGWKLHEGDPTADPTCITREKGFLTVLIRKLPIGKQGNRSIFKFKSLIYKDLLFTL